MDYSRLYVLSYQLILCFAFLQGGFAMAEQQCPEPAESQDLRELAAQEFRRGQELYEQGDCAAIHQFRCSFRLVPHPSTLYNIGRSAELCEMNDLAARTYRRFLDVFPDNEGIGEVEQRLSEIERRLAALEAQAEQHPSASEPAVEPEESSAQTAPPREEPTDTGEVSTPIGRDGLAIGAWTSLGLGLALTIPGIALIGAAASKANEFEALKMSDEWTYEALNDISAVGQTFMTTGTVLLVLGGVALASWIVLFAVSRARRARQDSLALSSGPWMSAIAASAGGGVYE